MACSVVVSGHAHTSFSLVYQLTWVKTVLLSSGIIKVVKVCVMTSQGTRNFAVLAALHTHYLTNGTSETLNASDRTFVTYFPFLAGVLIILLSAILIGVCLLMREKKKRIQEATSLSNLPWLETLEVFAVSGREGATGMFLPPATPGTPAPPPAYETVVKIPEKAKEAQEKSAVVASESNEETTETRQETQATVAVPSDDLPSYEAAVRMEGNM